MKTFTKRSLSVSLLAALVFSVPVQVSAVGDSTVVTEQPAAAPSTTLQERITQRKDTLNVKLAAAEQRRLKLRCKQAQVSVTKLNARLESNLPKRDQAYTKLQERLEKFITNMDASAGTDTTALKQHQAALETKVATYKTNIAAYKQALGDVTAIDCLQETAGFKASLEEARQLRTALRSEATAIRTFITDTVRPAIKQVRQAKTDTER